MDLIHDEVIVLSNLPNPSSHTGLGVDSASNRMKTRNHPGGKEWQTCNTENLIIICPITVWKMWELRCLTSPVASMAHYSWSFTILAFTSGMTPHSLLNTYKCFGWTHFFTFRVEMLFIPQFYAEDESSSSFIQNNCIWMPKCMVSHSIAWYSLLWDTPYFTK
jgi:hypothetical protein